MIGCHKLPTWRSHPPGARGTWVNDSKTLSVSLPPGGLWSNPPAGGCSSRGSAFSHRLQQMVGRNDSLVALFRELAQLTVLDEGSPNAFRVRAYENAVEAISSYRGDLEALSERELTAIAGIGQSTAKKIREFFQGGAIPKLEEQRLKYPPDFVELGKIPGLGPKTLLRLRSELGVRNLEDLRAALEAKKVREVHGLGEKMEEKLLHALDRQGAAGQEECPPPSRAPPHPPA